MDKSQYLKPREYEMMAILLPDQPEEETQAAVEKVLGYITDEQGTIDSVSTDSPWGRRRLAYTIRHEGVDYRDGHYVLVYFSSLASAISNIERELKLDTSVIRYLLLQHDPQMGEKIDESAVVEGEEAGDDAEEATDAPVSTEEVIAEEAAATEEEADAAPESDTEETAEAEEVVEEAADEESASTEAEAPAEESTEE